MSKLIQAWKMRKLTIMQMLVIVVAERTPEGWSAWLRDTPESVGYGSSDILAILTLIETHGTSEMDPWDMTKLEARSTEDHLEYLIPVEIGRQIPSSLWAVERHTK